MPVLADSRMPQHPASNSAADKVHSKKQTNVTLQIRHGIELPWGKPGFRISIGNWIPGSELSISAIGSSGERIVLVSTDDRLKADSAGEALIDIDYERKGLRPGHWVFVVAGKLGIHVIETDLPSVEPPTKERKTWKLDFGRKSAPK